jgi:hypothetical protein
VNVLANSKDLKRMLDYSKGDRHVPVIVDAASKVSIGYGGS